MLILHRNPPLDRYGAPNTHRLRAVDQRWDMQQLSLKFTQGNYRCIFPEFQRHLLHLMYSKWYEIYSSLLFHIDFSSCLDWSVWHQTDQWTRTSHTSSATHPTQWGNLHWDQARQQMMLWPGLSATPSTSPATSLTLPDMQVYTRSRILLFVILLSISFVWRFHLCRQAPPK